MKKISESWASTQLQGFSGRAPRKVGALGDELVQAQVGVLVVHGEGPFAQGHAPRVIAGVVLPQKTR